MNQLEKASFFWLLRTVESPQQQTFISLVFAPTLSFLSSSQDEDRIFGVKCATEILQNVPAPLIKSMGYHTILSDMLGKLMSMSHLPLLKVLHPCVLLLIEKHHEATSKMKVRICHAD